MPIIPWCGDLHPDFPVPWGGGGFEQKIAECAVGEKGPLCGVGAPPTSWPKAQEKVPIGGDLSNVSDSTEPIESGGVFRGGGKVRRGEGNKIPQRILNFPPRLFTQKIARQMSEIA